MPRISHRPKLSFTQEELDYLIKLSRSHWSSVKQLGMSHVIVFPFLLYSNHSSLNLSLFTCGSNAWLSYTLITVSKVLSIPQSFSITVNKSEAFSANIVLHRNCVYLTIFSGFKDEFLTRLWILLLTINVNIAVQIRASITYTFLVSRTSRAYLLFNSLNRSSISHLAP